MAKIGLRAERRERRLAGADYRDSLTEDQRNRLARNEALRGRHRGHRAFVIGNGPSLASQDLAPLGNEITIVMSGFWKHPVIETWQPRYYCLADPVFFDGSTPMREFLTALRARVKRTSFIVPLEAAESADGHVIDTPETFYVAFWNTLWRGEFRDVDFTDVLPTVRSVSQLGILVALYTGCDPIYLVGMDHDWLAQRGMDRHFYAGKTIEGHSDAHGDLDRIPYRFDLECALELWRGYEALRDVAVRRGVRILNASRGGFLDVFPSVKYESLLRGAHGVKS